MYSVNTGRAVPDRIASGSNEGSTSGAFLPVHKLPLCQKEALKACQDSRRVVDKGGRHIDVEQAAVAADGGLVHLALAVAGARRLIHHLG
ncbi:uncharacterized protein SPSK_05696 [Sporothrix schenckii 1099-18]|uniref:Uncharacterized protein n=1 Tax=Sporothrix schenckii 1099-18 TaxID=1397361 RepID=A0A0F2LTZ5_SPOSC|nr:uncharacterized protein SPSK_05696 [Sporothrix schenckii 1099-18]KJR80339.1 hypothetical protein SPSK_05696 [Sporothrix schenckii 1099-18]